MKYNLYYKDGYNCFFICSGSLVTSSIQAYVNVAGSYTQNMKMMGCYAKDVVPSCCIR